MNLHTKVPIVGIGSRIRQDEAAGPSVIDRLKKLIDAGHKPAFELELIDADYCFFVDMTEM